ncbi:hypothetical protein G6F29_012233 [Rhizopus arrhizus]|nr:hypothetical protein G6F24_012355 [Rhizopus arrhizus]KAG1400469.1 hypothetical protein G6F58_010938 [Rhizopus delemar]KAG0781181.1 hypothetical protein G6F22_009699 [Rhizopus arrhizus]KAG0974406.1 hypothetical protein G6F29_012233 [Rhizopus arrhizus]KAG0990060.1 hypothetical protein G6F28_009403 [Rhizopus arrhizus]
MKTSFLAILVAAAALIEAAPQPSSASTSASPSAGAAAASSSTAAGGGAGPVSITAPLEGTTWQIGSSQTVSWEKVKDGVDSLVINLMKGDSNALQLVQALATGIEATKGSTQVDVPKNVSAGNDYSLAVAPLLQATVLPLAPQTQLPLLQPLLMVPP